MSGIACAERLQSAGVEVVVIDRGHRLGGRMATRTMRGTKPFVFSNQKTGQGLAEIIAFIETQGMLRPGA